MKSKYNYKDVTGRSYNHERYAGPLSIRKSVVENAKNREEMSAKIIWRIEHMLAGVPVKRRAASPSVKELARIVEQYHLTKSESGKYQGDPDFIYDILCEHYDKAKEYSSYKSILYSLLYPTY